MTTPAPRLRRRPVWHLHRWTAWEPCDPAERQRWVSALHTRTCRRCGRQQRDLR